MAPTASDSALLDTMRPLTTKEIAEKARNFQWNPNIPLKAWLRTTGTLSQEGQSYLQDGNWGQAYLLYMRYMILVMEYLPSHPEFKTPEGKRSVTSLNSSLPNIATHLENIKPIIQRERDEWMEEVKETIRKEQRQKHLADDAKSKSPSKYDQRASRDPALSSGRLLDAGDNQGLAVELAQKEIRRRDATRKATRKAGVGHDEEQSRRIAGFWNSWSDDLAAKQAEDEEVFRRQMKSTRSKLDVDDDDDEDDLNGLREYTRSHSRPSQAPSSRASSYKYPTIAKSEPIQYEALKPYSRTTPTPPTQLPLRPPKVGVPYQHEASSSPTPEPKHPAKEQMHPERSLPTPLEPPKDLPPLPPKVHEEPPAPPKRLTFKPAAYLENGDPIRSIFLSQDLRQRFLNVASENTRRGLEMCGILCGTAVNNALFVTCLLIPEQKCTSDTCETENENSMLEYCMTEDLLMLGWIHTHPTQTCFMSSRDLHTQSGYQVMLPESIAIVCAPTSEPSYGIFRLTHPPGLNHILECRQESTFHAHKIDNLYTGAERPNGHVYEVDDLQFYIHDLRPGARTKTAQHIGI